MSEFTMSYEEIVDETLAAMAEVVYDVNVDNGWFEEDRPFVGDIALLHSEVSEALEEYRTYADVATRFECKRDVEVPPDLDLQRRSLVFFKGTVYASVPGDVLAANVDAFKPVGVGSELADVLIRTLDTAKRYDINLGEEFRRKLAFNTTRGHKHGGKAI